MNPQLRAVASRQGGVFTRAQAISCGCSERELRTRTGARGDWVVVRRGAYVERSIWEALDADGRYRLEVRAVMLNTQAPAVPTHSSAAVFLGFPMRPHWRRLVHVTRPDVTGGRVEAGVSHHRSLLTADDCVLVEGLVVSAPSRTAVDIGREFGFEDGVVAADAALRGGASRGELEGQVARMRCWPRITGARAAVDAADAGAESIGESLTRVLIEELGMGSPETQVELSDGSRKARVDLRLRRHLIEFDGKVKYVGRADGGFADRPVEQVVWEEKRREDWLRECDGGYGVSRVVWAELFGPAREVTKRRLAREIARSDRLYGHLTDASDPERLRTF
jgi:hypothetical protein